MNKLAFPLIAAASLMATQAMAGPKYRYSDDDRRDRYEERDVYRAPAGAYEYADVVNSQPIYRTVRVEQPRNECWDERVVYRDRRDGYDNNGAGGAVVGAVIGGVAGHQIGHGSGRDAATVLGAIIGASVGQSVAVRNNPRPYESERVGYEERCRTVSDYHVEQRVEAYDVTYRYGGRTYHTTMPYDPGNRIPVDVNVRPVQY